MAEGGYEPIPTEDNQGYDYDDYDHDGSTFSTQRQREEWGREHGQGREWDEYHRNMKQYKAYKFKDTVSEKTWERWKSQEKDDEHGPPREEIPMKTRGETTFIATPQDIPGWSKKTSTNKVEETLFGGTRTLEEKMKELGRVREQVRDEVLKVFPNIDKKYLPLINFDDYGRLVYKGDKVWKDGVDHNIPYIIAINGVPSEDFNLKSKFPKGLKDALGKSNLQINDENLEKQRILEEEQRKKEQRLDELRRERDKIDRDNIDSRARLEEFSKELDEHEKVGQGLPTVQEAEYIRERLPEIREGMREEKQKIIVNKQNLERLDQDITKEETGVRNGQEQVEAARERVNQRLLSLRDRVKEIFKKYGFTVFAVTSAIGVVIGVIVSNLKAGLTSVAKGVGNGLKELGAKLGQILPGMVGAIASFLFKTAGEAIGFLAKNAWLLIVGLVVLAVEQFKKRSR